MNVSCHLPIGLLFCATLRASEAQIICRHFDGARVAQEATLPLKADPVAGTGVAWKTEIGCGHSPAIVMGIRMVVLVETEAVVCLDLFPVGKRLIVRGRSTLWCLEQ